VILSAHVFEPSAAVGGLLFAAFIVLSLIALRRPSRCGHCGRCRSCGRHR
jgi:hypothetical protein